MKTSPKKTQTMQVYKTSNNTRLPILRMTLKPGQKIPDTYANPQKMKFNTLASKTSKGKKA